MDDFGVKYVGTENVENLINILKQYYTISEDWGGTKYVRLTLNWDYEGRKVHFSMPGYMEKVLKRFRHEKPKKRKTLQNSNLNSKCCMISKASRLVDKSHY